MTSVFSAPVGMKCHESLLYVAAGSSVMAVDLRTMRREFTFAQQAKIHSFEFLPSRSLLCTGETGRYWYLLLLVSIMQLSPSLLL